MNPRNAADTRADRIITPLTQAHPHESGLVAMDEGRDAFAARVALADAAERTLDAQYYIWHNDMSGALLFEALHRAADRGVRVRLLLDDNNTNGLDVVLAALNSHPNINVRLFNPFRHRRWRALGYVTDFARLNRRMHNKSFTVDGTVTIIGGRNVGDEYFDAGGEMSFVDLDVLAIGPVAREVETDFERYWTSDSAWPAERVLAQVSPAVISELAAAAIRVEHDPAAATYMRALARQPFVRDLLAGDLQFEWAVTHLVSDDPAKGLGSAAEDDLLWGRLRRGLGRPVQELELVAAYFVPTAAGVEYFVALAKEGVKVTILTNSLAATDVAVVHAGYAKWRKPLLKAGVSLFELKPSSAPRTVRDRGLTGHSASSLHAKVFSVDCSRVFIGSFNFDPRSLHLNTEMGFVIDSGPLARTVAEMFAEKIRPRAYEVGLGDGGALQWTDERGGKKIVHDDEPGAGFWRRLSVAIAERLPVEWLL